MNRTVEKLNGISRHIPAYFKWNVAYVVVSLIKEDPVLGIIEYSVYNYVKNSRHVIVINVLRETFSVYVEWVGCRFPKVQNRSYVDVFAIIRSIRDIL